MQPQTHCRCVAASQWINYDASHRGHACKQIKVCVVVFKLLLLLLLLLLSPVGPARSSPAPQLVPSNLKSINTSQGMQATYAEAIKSRCMTLVLTKQVRAPTPNTQAHHALTRQGKANWKLPGETGTRLERRNFICACVPNHGDLNQKSTLVLYLPRLAGPTLNTVPRYFCNWERCKNVALLLRS